MQSKTGATRNIIFVILLTATTDYVLNCVCTGPREQLNQVTHWLDGSEIYGSSKRELDLLRDFSDAGKKVLLCLFGLSNQAISY